MNKKKTLFLSQVVIIIFVLLGTIHFSNPSNYNHGAIAEETLHKTIDFEDLASGYMSVTAHNSYYDGLIVADGKITTTAKTKIDNNTLGMRMPASSVSDPRRATIKVSGYTKIVLDLKQERTYTRIKTGCAQLFFGTTNGQIMRDIEIPTYGYHEIILTFYTETMVASTMDCGIDNIRFYALGPAPSSSENITSVDPSSSESSISEPPSSSAPAREDTPALIGDMITMRGIADYLETKQKYYPLSNEFVETYQQTSGGYIALAKSLGLLVDKSQHEPNQKWHFFDSWLYPSIADGTITWDADAKVRVYTRLLSPELLLWIYEACDAPTSKVQAALDVAVEGKIAGTHVSTIAKNMRACVPWTDLEVNIKNFLLSN